MQPGSQVLTGIIFILTLISACGPGKPVNRDGLEEEMQSRELKRITEATITTKAEEIGLAALTGASSTLKKTLKSQIQNHGIQAAMAYCNLNALTLVTDLEDSLGVKIRRITDRVRNPLDTMNADEKEIFEAYKYTPDVDDHQIIKLNQTHFLLTNPIKISDGLCLNCHGSVGKEITEENYVFLKEKYPQDRATGYQVGDLRGMWSILIPRKSVVDRL